MNIVSMEELVAVTLERTRSGGVLIAIAHLGDGETSREISRRRLFNVHEFVKDLAATLKDKVVVAEGERVNGLGRVEFYLTGEKVGTLLMKRGKDLCLICCSDDGPYYPQKDFSRNPPKRRPPQKH